MLSRILLLFILGADIALKVDAVNCVIVAKQDRRDCGYSHDQSQCESNGCCFKYEWTVAKDICFYPALAKCYNVAKENRIDCGDESNEACVAKGCCYDSDVGSGVPHCYHDANHIVLSDICAYVENSAKQDCGYGGIDADTCKGKGCCYDNNVSNAPHCFWPDSECLVIEQNQRTNCGFDGISSSQCKEKGCCYQDNVASGVPRCFMSKTQFDNVCLAIDQDQQVNCGFGGMTMTSSQCKQKGCCYQDNVPSGVPQCLLSKTQLDDRCNSIKPGIRIDCGWKDLTKEECEALGCCYDANAPWYRHACFHKAKDQCTIVNVTKRRLCGHFEYGKESCEEEEKCCYDDTDYGFHTVKCFAAQPVCGGDVKRRRPCGNSAGDVDARSCALLGCCYDGSGNGYYTKHCYYPSDHDFEGDYCMAVDPYQRRDCGPGADNATCLAKGCCYDDAYYGGAPGCFYNSKKTQCGVDIRKRKQCGSPGVNRTSCEDLNCCFDPQFYGNYTIYCYAPETEEPSPPAKTCSTNGTRLDCGKVPLWEPANECDSRGCCYEESDIYYDCYKTQEMLDDVCDGIPVADRIDCGWPGIIRQHCEGKGCCYDTMEYNYPDAKHCFYPKGRSPPDCSVEESKRRSCGSHDQMHCEAKGCCFVKPTPWTSLCYYAVGQAPATEAPPLTEAPPTDYCKAVDPNKRVDCGFSGINGTTCEERGCCYEENSIYTYWCFYPANHSMAACSSGDPRTRIDCGSGDKDTCKAMGCCFDSTNYGYQTKWCFVPPGQPVPSEVCNKIRKDLRNDCGSFNITQDECVKSVCCYDKTDNGTCFDPKTDKCSDVSREKRFPCEQRGKEQMICEGKGCCHDGGASWDEPTCFFHSGHPLSVCAYIEPNQGTHCGPQDFDRTSCEALGCCFFETTVGYYEKFCFHPPAPPTTLPPVVLTEECKNVSRSDRFACESNDAGRRACEDRKCCYDDSREPSDPWWYEPVACYFPIDHPLAVCAHTDHEGREHCGPHDDFDRTSCEALGCCFFEYGDKFCFPPPRSTPVTEECKNVSSAERFVCEPNHAGPKACEEKKCCFDEFAGYWDVACYYPTDHPLAACHSVWPSDGIPCASGDFSRQSCESLGCCFHETKAGVSEKWCFYPPGVSPSKISTSSQMATTSPVLTSSSAVPPSSSSIPPSSLPDSSSSSPASSSPSPTPSSPTPSPTSSSQIPPTTPSPTLPSSEITVLCEDEYMTVMIAKSLLPYVDREHLRLLDRGCTASETSAHFYLTTPLNGCLTTVSHTANSVIYSNRVLENSSDINDIVTREKYVEISFSCQYSKSGVVSSVGWKPKNNVVIYNDEGRGNFTMTLDMFPTSDFAIAYTQNDFPVAVQIQQPLFFEVSVRTGDSQLSIRADHCYATPTQDRNSLVKYDFIQAGCPTDPSVQFLATDSNATQRFTLEAFQFIAEHPFVFVHCHVIICDAADSLSDCKKVCPSEGMKKRDVPDHVSDKYSLVQGPIHLARQKRDGDSMELSTKDGSSVAVMMVLALACAVCLIGTVLLLAKKSTGRSARYIRLTSAESPIAQ